MGFSLRLSLVTPFGFSYLYDWLSETRSFDLYHPETEVTKMSEAERDEEALTLEEAVETLDDDVETAEALPFNHVCSFSEGPISQNVYVCIDCSQKKGKQVGPFVFLGFFVLVFYDIE
jgi:hypothetical protein